MAEHIEIEAPIYRGSDRRPGMDPATRRLTVFAASLGAVLVLSLGAVSLFGHHGGGAVPVIAADNGPMKVKPSHPGGMQIAGTNSDVMAASQGTDQGKLAPGPEVPDPAALAAQRAAAQAQAQQAQARAAAAAAPAIAARAPEPAVPAPAAVARAVAPSPAARTAAPAAADHGVATGHGTQVQLAALSSSEAAHTEWTRLQHRMPGLLDGHQPAVSRFELGGHVFWRLRTGGFASIAAATHFCEQMRAKHTACSIATF